MSIGDAFHGLEIPLREVPGARAVRVVHPRAQVIDEHRHDWPSLTLHALGSYTELFEGAEVRVNGPAAVFHPAGEYHANVIDSGLETVSIQFDPDWLKRSAPDLNLERAGSWSGGEVALRARALASAWSRPTLPERTLRAATANFLVKAFASEAQKMPNWLPKVREAIDAEQPPKTESLAKSLGLHPAWLARAYRLAAGEGLHETLRRRRVEHAVDMLRETDDSLAQITVAAGFYDQSHMSRAFKALIGRTPLRVRCERNSLRNFA